MMSLKDVTSITTALLSAENGNERSLWEGVGFENSDGEVKFFSAWGILTTY